MADEYIRIKDLSTETTLLTDDDYVMIDSPNNGPSKYDLNRLQQAISEGLVSLSYSQGTATLTLGGQNGNNQ